MAISTALIPSAQTVYTVSRLNREVRFALNQGFGSLWIEGEISNFAAPASGHLYFTLKDAEAQVRCALFRPQARLLGFKPKNGDQVLIKAQVSLYEPRGDFQLIVESMEPAGDGVLLRAFEALKRRLAAEGLFDAARKRPIPKIPVGIGVITSPTGAAVWDILTVLRRRFPAIPVIIFPVKVQGTEAKSEIVRALKLADKTGYCDVLILARGGGSLEDLWAFNEETVARAIFATQTPVVSGIGHETDFTIADFVADLRAPTPSAAAEAASPDSSAWLANFRRLESALAQRLRAILYRQETRLNFLDQRLGRAHPRQRLLTQSQRLDELELRLRRGIRNTLRQREGMLRAQSSLLMKHHPGARLRFAEVHCGGLGQRLAAEMLRILERKTRRGVELSHRLHTLSPLATLARGYAIASRADTGDILHSHRDIAPGEHMETRLAEGMVVSRVESCHQDISASLDWPEMQPRTTVGDPNKLEGG